MKKNVIISLADANYFELINELVDSIKSFKQSVREGEDDVNKKDDVTLHHTSEEPGS